MEDFLSILCDPITKEDLRQENGSVVSSDFSYPIVQNIPLLLRDKLLADDATRILSQNKSANGFSWAESHWHDLKINELLEESKTKGARLLNFGSGSPEEKKEVEKKGYKVIALDINAKYKGVDVIGDGHNLPFKKGMFDVVTAFEVLEHLHSPWIAIKEINSVLPIGGKFVGSVAFLKEFHHSYFHMSHWGVIQLLEGAGFEIEKIYGGQNVLSRLVNNFMPIGPSKISKSIYDALYNATMKIRQIIWSKKHGIDADTPLDRFDKVKLSFKEWEQIKYSPTILFRAVKTKDLIN